MTQWLFLLSDIAATLVRAAACLFLIARLLPVDTDESIRRQLTALLPAASLLSAVLFFTELPELYRQLTEAVLLAFFAARRRSAGRRMCLFVCIYFEIAAAFWQFLTASGLCVLFRSRAFLARHTAAGQLALWLLYLLLLVCAARFFKREDPTGKDAFRAASALSVAGLIAVITLSEQTRLTIPDDLLDMWTILAVVLLMAVLVFNLNRHYESEKELASLKSEQAALLERENRAYAMNAKLFHDFHNHIGALRHLLTHGQYEQAVQYLDELQEPLREMADTVWTGDPTVDYLISRAFVETKAAHIAFQAQVEFPRNTGLRSADLCAILGNLLDNALEATRQVADPQARFLRLTIRRVNHLLLNTVENSAPAAPVTENGALKTTKTAHGLHGWGIKSARTAAEKYDGVLQSSYENGIFRAVATLSFPSSPANGRPT